jgi:hypothetical protein
VYVCAIDVSPGSRPDVAHYGAHGLAHIPYLSHALRRGLDDLTRFAGYGGVNRPLPCTQRAATVRRTHGHKRGERGCQTLSDHSILALAFPVSSFPPRCIGASSSGNPRPPYFRGGDNVVARTCFVDPRLFLAHRIRAADLQNRSTLLH